MATYPTSASTVDFSNGGGQTERFWIYYRIGTRHYFPEHRISMKKEEKELSASLPFAQDLMRMNSLRSKSMKDHGSSCRPRINTLEGFSTRIITG